MAIISSGMQQWELRQQGRERAARALQTEYPHLVAVSAKNNALVAAGKNIRIELARAFPGVKFAVRSQRYSGGDSIDISWTDGPTTEQVDPIIGKYRAGSFDGMNDSYDYRDDRAWTDAFGDAKYVHSQRQYSDKMLASVMLRVAHYLGGLDRMPTVDDYRQGRYWNVTTSGGCDYSHQLSIALAKHTCCITRS